MGAVEGRVPELGLPESMRGIRIFIPISVLSCTLTERIACLTQSVNFVFNHHHPFSEELMQILCSSIHSSLTFLFCSMLCLENTLRRSLHWVSASLVVDAVWVRGIERLIWIPAGRWLSPRCWSLGILRFFTSAIPSEFIPIRHNNDDYLRWLALFQGAKNSHNIWFLEISTCPRLLKCSLCVQHMFP